ncbi:extracellular solute-binding protein [Paenibacillus lycopersici]|uniref:Extracellular solute-binding protein n=1 Tax=Paenibacillus lycopersici TaxID=2704462 RepID=A0A6C0FNS7_9BACL|nr:extracellular solute-binding protein [Paenibacillus lycopersici]QHT58758.1 extracellular solute-binding protein [Paenibacillus lycopersici]
MSKNPSQAGGRTYRILFPPIAAMLLLSACSGGNLTARNDDPVTIRIQLPIIQKDPTSITYENAARHFHELNPNMTIELAYASLKPGSESVDLDPTKLLKSDHPPDIMPLPQFRLASVANQGLLKDLRQLQSADSSVKIDIPQGLLDTTTVNGELLLLPYAAFPVVVYYNKQLFDNAQIPYPTGEWTWEQFKETSKKLKAPFGSILPYDIWTLDELIGSLGTGLLSKDGTTAVGYLDSPAAASAVQWLNAYYKDDPNKRGPQTAVDAFEQFGSYGTGMTVNGAGVQYRGFQGDSQSLLGVAPLPYFENGKRVNPLDVLGYGISAKSEHPAEAWKFMAYLLLTDNADSKELAKGFYPTSKTIEQAGNRGEHAMEQVFMGEMDYAAITSLSNSPYIYKAWDAPLEQRFDALLDAKDEDIPDKLHEIAQQLDQALAREKAASERLEQEASAGLTLDIDGT